MLKGKRGGKNLNQEYQAKLSFRIEGEREFSKQNFKRGHHHLTHLTINAKNVKGNSSSGKWKAIIRRKLWKEKYFTNKSKHTVKVAEQSLTKLE